MSPPIPWRLITPAEVLPIVKQLIARGVSIGLDTETTGLDPWRDRLITMQIGTPQGINIVDMRHATIAELLTLAEAVRLLLSGQVELLGHHLKFDLVWLAVHLGIHPDDLRPLHGWDTLLAEQVILGGLHDENGTPAHAGLDATAARYGYAIPKEARSWFADLDQRPAEWNAQIPPEQLAYAARDLVYLPAICACQREQLAALGLEQTAELEMRCLPAVSAMELAGVAVDVPGWRDYIRRREAEAASIAERLQATLWPTYRAELIRAQVKAAQALREWESERDKALVNARASYAALPTRERPGWGEARSAVLARFRADHPRPATPKAIPDCLNLGSPQQLLRALALVGVHLVNTDSETLEDHRDDHPAVADLLTWRKLNKLVTAFGEPILSRVGSDGRIHPHYQQIGAEEGMVSTGRMSCRQPNWQQLPAHDRDSIGDRLRDHVIAAPGHVLLSCDYSNIEARVAAERSCDPALLAVFEQGGDLHTQVAISIFGLPPDTTKEQAKALPFRPNVSMRDAAKTATYAMLFGAGPRRLQAELRCSLTDAQALRDRYFAAYRALKGYLDQTASHAARVGYVRTIGGRRRNFSLQDEPERHAFVSWDAYLAAREAWQIEQSRIRRQAANAAIQGTAADILKLALALLFQRLPDGAALVAAVHDEIVIEAVESVADQAADILARTMEQAARFYLRTVALGSFSVTRAPYWAEH